MTDEQQAHPEQQPQVIEVSLYDLLGEVNLAMEVMSKHNPHRRTLYKLGGALEALSRRYIQKCGECDELTRKLEAYKTINTEEDTHEQSYIESPTEQAEPATASATNGIILTDA